MLKIGMLSLFILLGLLFGGFFNMGIILAGQNIIPLPPGINPEDMESLKANFHLFEPKHFIVPFIAHAVGTLIGCFFASFLSAVILKENPKLPCFAISGLFFLGGLFNIIYLPSPIWFSALDLLVAYFPAGFLGYTLAGSFMSKFLPGRISN